MAERDYRWQKTDAASEGWRQLESIPAPALVIDARGREFFKASGNPAEEQYFGTTGGEIDLEKPIGGGYPWDVTTAPYDFLAEVGLTDA